MRSLVLCRGAKKEYPISGFGRLSGRFMIVGAVAPTPHERGLPPPPMGRQRSGSITCRMFKRLARRDSKEREESPEKLLSHPLNNFGYFFPGLVTQ